MIVRSGHGRGRGVCNLNSVGNTNGSSVSRSSGNVCSAFDGSLGIGGAWVHSNPTGCTYNYCQTPGCACSTISSDKTALDLTLVTKFPQ